MKSIDPELHEPFPTKVFVLLFSSLISSLTSCVLSLVGMSTKLPPPSVIVLISEGAMGIGFITGSLLYLMKRKECKWLGLFCSAVTAMTLVLFWFIDR